MLIKNAIVCDTKTKKELDVRIEDGMIVEMGLNLEDDKVKCKR